MNKLCVFAFVLCCVVVLALGCGGNDYFEPVKEIKTENMTKAQVMAVCEDVLSGMHFSIDKLDAESGVVVTRPLTGGQFFEFWRNDSVGRFNKAEANLHSIQRIVRMEVAEQDVGGVRVSCSAATYRLSLPERQVDNSSQMYGMFTKSSRSLQKMKLQPGQEREMQWVPMGEDEKLSTHILKLVDSQIAGTGQ